MHNLVVKVFGPCGDLGLTSLVMTYHGGLAVHCSLRESVQIDVAAEHIAHCLPMLRHSGLNLREQGVLHFADKPGLLLQVLIGLLAERHGVSCVDRFLQNARYIVVNIVHLIPDFLQLVKLLLRCLGLLQKLDKVLPG